jgi:hypothetical protein
MGRIGIACGHSFRAATAARDRSHLARRAKLRGGRSDSPMKRHHNEGVPRLSRICAIAVLLAISAESVWAIEKFSFISTADVVVVGRLKLSSYFLSVDGLHVNGRIAASEVLYGEGHANSEFEYHVVVPCSLWDALTGSAAIGAIGSIGPKRKRKSFRRRFGRL